MPAKSRARGRKRKSTAVSETKNQVEEDVTLSQSTEKYVPRFGSAVKRPRSCLASDTLAPSTQPVPTEQTQQQCTQQASTGTQGPVESTKHMKLDHPCETTDNSSPEPPSEQSETQSAVHPSREPEGEEASGLPSEKQFDPLSSSFIPGFALSQVVRSPERAPAINDSLDEGSGNLLADVIPDALVCGDREKEKDSPDLSQSVHSEKNLSLLNPFELDDEVDADPQCDNALTEANHGKGDDDGVEIPGTATRAIQLASPKPGVDNLQEHSLINATPLLPPVVTPDAVLPNSQEQLRLCDSALIGSGAKSFFDKDNIEENKDKTATQNEPIHDDINTNAKSLLDDSIEDTIVVSKHGGALSIVKQPTLEEQYPILDTNVNIDTSSNSGVVKPQFDKSRSLSSEPTEEDYAAVQEMMMDISATELIGSQFGDEDKVLVSSPFVREQLQERPGNGASSKQSLIQPNIPTAGRDIPASSTGGWAQPNIPTAGRDIPASSTGGWTQPNIPTAGRDIPASSTGGWTQPNIPTAGRDIPASSTGGWEGDDSLEGTAMLRGLISELSSLNRFVMNCKKELDGMQRQRQIWLNKTSTSNRSSSGGGNSWRKGYRKF